jgi:arsenate reductase
MAEAILRAAAGDLFEVFSAGSKPKGTVHPLALQAIEELGISTEGHTSDHLDIYLNQGINTVITVCGKADKVCPIFLGQVNRYHWGFEDPPSPTTRGGKRDRSLPPNPRRY